MSYEEFLATFAGKILSHRQNGNRLFFMVRDEDLREIARFLFAEMGCRLSTSTGLAVYGGYEVQHHFSHDRAGRYFCPTVKVPAGDPAMESIAAVTKAAAWIEREIHDLLGIVFRGHPDLRPLLKEDNEGIAGYPLRHEGENK